MRAGMGGGGGCHPRDNIALSYIARKLNISYDWWENLMIAREKQTEWLASLILDQVSNTGYGVLILGSAFKPETNLQTGSPAILLYNILILNGSYPKIFDPYIDEATILDEYKYPVKIDKK